jgi:hypothetical protein
VLLGDGLPVPADRAFVHGEQAQDPPHRGGLARSVRTQKANQLTPFYFEIDSSKRNNVAERLVQPAYDEPRSHLDGTSSSQPS